MKKAKESVVPNRAESPVRVDKWLKVARLYKTRSLAQEAISGGHVKLGGTAVKPGRGLNPGDILEITKGRRRLKLEVVKVTERSVAAALARELYRILEEEIQEDPHREFNANFRRVVKTARGRPTKKERRDLEKFKKRFQ